MSEKKEQGFFGQLKNQIIAGAGVILTGLGAMFLDEVKSFIGIEDEEEQAQVEDVQKNKQEVNVTGPEIIINIPEQKTETKTIIKEVPVEKKKEKEEEIDW